MGRAGRSGTWCPATTAQSGATCAGGSWSRSACSCWARSCSAISLRIDPGSRWFYAGTLGLAGVWAVGAFASGPLHLGRIPLGSGHPGRWSRRSCSGCCWPGSSWSAPSWCGTSTSWRPRGPGRQGHGLRRPGLGAAARASSPRSTGSPRSCSSAGRRTPRSRVHPVLWTTAAYGVATAATGNVMLTFAALLLGLVVGLERRASRRHPRPRSSPTAPGRSTMLFALPLRLLAATRLVSLRTRRRAATASRYGHRLAGHDVLDRVVGLQHLGAHRVDEVAGRGGVDVGDQPDPVATTAAASAPGRSRSAPCGR